MINDNIDLAKLVREAKAGNAEALTEIYNATKKNVYFIVRESVGNEHDTADIMQEIYTKVFFKLGDLRDDNAFKSWLNKITQNCICDFARRKQPIADGQEHEQEELSEEFLPQEYVDSQAKQQLVMDIIDRLPDVQRTVILLFYYEGMPIAQIADHMECSESTIKSRLNYAKRTIKREVEALEKKGTKLYAIPAIPVLTQILRAMSQNYSMPEAVSERVLNATLETVAAGAVAGSVASGASAAAETTAATTAAETTAAAGAKAAVPLAAKIGGAVAAVGIGAAAIVGGISGSEADVPYDQYAKFAIAAYHYSSEMDITETDYIWYYKEADPIVTETTPEGTRQHISVRGDIGGLFAMQIRTKDGDPIPKKDDITDIVVTVNGEDFPVGIEAIGTRIMNAETGKGETWGEYTYLELGWDESDEFYDSPIEIFTRITFDREFNEKGNYTLSYTYRGTRYTATPVVWGEKRVNTAPIGSRERYNEYEVFPAPEYYSDYFDEDYAKSDGITE